VAVPAVLGGDLRQQQTAVEALLHDQPMTPNLNGVDRLELTLRGEHGDLERDIGQLLGPDAIEARIGVGYRLRELHDETRQRKARVEATETAAQSAGVEDRDEGTAPDIQVDVDVGRVAAVYARLERSSRQRQQTFLLWVPDHVSRCWGTWELGLGSLPASPDRRSHVADNRRLVSGHITGIGVVQH